MFCSVKVTTMDTADENLEGKVNIKIEVKQENETLLNESLETNIKDESWLLDLNEIKSEPEALGKLEFLHTVFLQFLQYE